MEDNELLQRNHYFRYLHVDASSRSWGMFVTTCGRSFISANGNSYPPVQHPPLYQFDWQHGRILDEYQIVYISEGAGSFETKDQKIQLECGDAIVLRPGQWHRYRPKLETGWREYWIGFSGSGFTTIFDRHFCDRSVFQIRGSAAVREAFETLIATAQENGPALQQQMAARASLLLALLYASTLEKTNSTQDRSKMVQRARAIMWSSETQDLPLEELARQLGASYSTFRRVFREQTGMGPHRYRLNLKLSHARDLLLNTDLSIKEIAFRSGFEEEQYFCRFFKKTMKKSPSNYRKQFIVHDPPRTPDISQSMPMTELQDLYYLAN